MPVKAKPFTVVGYYEDNNQPYVDHVKACDWVQALQNAVLTHQNQHEVRGLIFLSVFPGHHKDQCEHEYGVFACDVPGLEWDDEHECFTFEPTQSTAVPKSSASR